MDTKPDIICLNETKLHQEAANLLISIEDYTIHHRGRNASGGGGGVAIIVANHLEHTLVKLPLLPDTEALVISLSCANSGHPLTIATLYNPPSNTNTPQTSFELFEKLDQLAKTTGSDLLVVGDLNAKTGALGHPTNAAGIQLDDLLNQYNLVLANDAIPTYYRFNSDYAELLDMAIYSPGLASKISGVTTHDERRMGSDQAPIELTIAGHYAKLDAERSHAIANSFNFNKADWLAFAAVLPSTAPTDVLGDVDLLNTYVCQQILKAARASIPPKTRGARINSYPAHIVKVIIERRVARSRANRDETARPEYNRLTNLLEEQIFAYRNSQWDTFIKSLGSRPSATRPLWRKINKARNGAHNQGNNCKLTKPDGTRTKNDGEKAELFASTLASTFRGSTANFDETHRKKVENELKLITESTAVGQFSPVTDSELMRHIHRLPKNSAAGESGVHNALLRKLPPHFRWLIVHLINLSLVKSHIPSAWKQAIIVMLPKSRSNLHDPNNYRPISLLCCLGKLCERVVQGRLYTHLESNGLLSPQQSGFRRFRRTADNILFLTQKVQENLNKRKKVCCFFFDLKKAFDNVWHAGLLAKLATLNTPAYIFLWITAFLENRTFRVRVSDAISSPGSISAGVPQGAVLSPTLFNVFVNDIPLESTPSKSYSTLYADDLAVYFTYTTDGAHCARVTKYLGKLEAWLFANRLEMNVAKTCYMIFTRSPKAKKNYDFMFNGQKIHHDPNPKFLGVIMDERVNFGAQVQHIREKCSSRLNIMRIISHKSWKLSSHTLTNVYKALIGSIIDYSALISCCLSDEYTKSLQAIQNKAMRTIFGRPFDCPTDELCRLGGCPRVATRQRLLAAAHVDATKSTNPLISILVRDYNMQISSIRRDKAPKTTLCDIFVFNPENVKPLDVPPHNTTQNSFSQIMSAPSTLLPTLPFTLSLLTRANNVSPPPTHNNQHTQHPISPPTCLFILSFIYLLLLFI